MQSTPQTNIGEIIRKQLKDEGRTLVWLAKQVHCDSSNLTKLLSHSSIHTDLLTRISIVLKTDFFKYFSNNIQNVIHDDKVHSDIVSNYSLYDDRIYYEHGCE
jgi:plasmid maintenance system antidote protein VapI